MKTRKESGMAVMSRERLGFAGIGRRFISILFSSFVLFCPLLRGGVLVLKNGRVFKGDIVRWDEKHYLVPQPKQLVPLQDVAWVSSRKDTDAVIREWWEGIRKRPDLEDALLPLARFCLQEGRKRKGLEFARAWGKFRLWKAYLSRDFLLLTNAKKAPALALGARLDAAMDLFRGEFPGSRVLRYGCAVRFFATWKDFHRFAQTLPSRPGTTFYSPRERMIYLPDTRLETLQWTYSGAYREACSYFLIECLLQYHPKYTWILAGTGTCFETCRFENGKLVGAWRKRPRYVERIRVGMKSRTYTPLEKFLRLGSGGFGPGDAYQMHFAEAWSLVWFLHESGNPAYRQAYFRYLDLLKKEKDDDKALKKVFYPLGLKKLERDWKAFFGVRR